MYQMTCLKYMYVYQVRLRYLHFFLGWTNFNFIQGDTSVMVLIILCLGVKIVVLFALMYVFIFLVKFR